MEQLSLADTWIEAVAKSRVSCKTSDAKTSQGTSHWIGEMWRTNPGGADGSRRINLDSLGQLYISLVIIWTALLGAGIGFLIVNRNLPFLRLRNLALGIAAVCTLHVYWMLIMLAYTMNGTFPCSLEFWIMSIYLPFGIALYQANSTQLQHVAGLQRRFVNTESTYLEIRPNPNVKGYRQWIVKWDRLNVTQRAIIGITFGMVLQVSSEGWLRGLN